LPEEAKLLIERTGRPELLIDEGEGFFSIKKAPGAPCPFLTEERLCGVYDIRPIDCRSWPLTLNATASPQEQLLEDLDCPPVQQRALSKGFEKASQVILSTIPEKHRERFVELVHRDFKNDAIRHGVHESAAHNGSRS
jgi:Fe-S-cluster containining protein